MTFSFVIPVYNNYGLLHTILWDIYKNCSRPDEVLILDDCSTEKDVKSGVEWWTRTDLLPIEYIRQEENLGFLLNSNYGLKRAKGDIVCLVSTDVRVHKDVVSVISKELGTYSKSLIGGRHLEFDTGWNTFQGRIFPYLEGWFLAATKDGWKEFGYFDEQYVPNDMEDVDLSTTAASLGYAFVEIPSEMLSHIGAQSIGYNPEREEITLRNKKKFEEKWVKKVNP